jgi:hypothetical protein
VLRNDPVSELDRQLSYCIKFVTYDFLPRGSNGAKGKAVSLKGSPLDELVEWRSRYSPGDFLFLYGAKRQNGKFVRTRPRAKRLTGSKRRPISTASPASTGNLAMRKAQPRIDA